MTRTINLSNTQFRYQLAFFVHISGYILLAEGCLWHLLPRQNLPSASFAQAKHAPQYVLPGCVICLIQRKLARTLESSTVFFPEQSHCLYSNVNSFPIAAASQIKQATELLR